MSGYRIFRLGLRGEAIDEQYYDDMRESPHWTIKDKKMNDEYARQFKQLGWANGWAEGKEPEEYKRCRELKHAVEDIDIGPPWRGLDHRCRCGICMIEWHYDSSD